jgi:hypothetical protein
VKNFLLAILFNLGLLTAASATYAAESAVPEPFQGHDESSKYTIDYADLTALLKLVVVDVGRSTREKAEPTQAKTGTRMKASVKRSTVNEGNRFYFESFSQNEDARQVLINIQKSLEQIPDEAPLSFFSRDEQLAYWLNLYNVAILNEIIDIYPKNDLKKFLVGKKSIKSKKLLTVAGIPLSLDDIQYTILNQNYDNDPLIIYGLYQGNIGGPNIRRTAYTGSNVRRFLANNATEFTNSNRGTYSKDERTFRVSSLYDRNRMYFPDFNEDLSKHLLVYLNGYEQAQLKSSSTLKADINDWTVTDLGGSYRDMGGAFADSNAALLDSVKGTTAADGGGVMAAAAGPASSMLAQQARRPSRIPPELLVQLQALNLKRERTNADKATVTVEELGQYGVDSDPDAEPESDNEKKK